MPECTADTDLTLEETDRLSALPDAAYEVKSTVECELEEGHAGPHYGLAQSDDRGADDSTNWWLWWSDGVRGWSHEPCCYIENTATAELCVLPKGHQGSHVF